MKLSIQFVVATVYVLAMFLNIMDSTIVNVALPAIARELGVAVQATDGVVVAYLVSVAIWIPASGWVGDRWGTKRTFLAALAIFVVASALCGLAQNLLELVVFRVIQGIGGGMLVPVGMAMLFRAFPPHQRAWASQILVVPTIIAPAIGPVLGGLLVDQLSWRWAFYINVPIGLLALIFGLAYLMEHREADTGEFDGSGFVLAAVGFALLLLALSEGPVLGWLQPLVMTAGVGSLIALAGLVWVEARHSSPLLDLRLFKNQLFAVTNVVSFASSAGFIGLLFVTPLFLQEVVRVSAVTSGLSTFPESIGVLVGTQGAARLYPTIGPRRLLIGGMVFAALCTGLLSLLDQRPELWLVRVAMFMVGVGMAFVFLALQTASFATISSRETGRASAVFSTQRQVGSAFGVALLASVLAALGPPTGEALSPPLSAFRVAFLVAAALFGLGALAAVGVIDREAAGTMQQ